MFKALRHPSAFCLYAMPRAFGTRLISCRDSRDFRWTQRGQSCSPFSNFRTSTHLKSRGHGPQQVHALISPRAVNFVVVLKIMDGRGCLSLKLWLLGKEGVVFLSLKIVLLFLSEQHGLDKCRWKGQTQDGGDKTKPLYQICQPYLCLFGLVVVLAYPFPLD